MSMPATVGISRFAAGDGDRHTALRGAIWAAMVAHGGGHYGMDGVRDCSGVTVGEECGRSNGNRKRET